MALLILLKRFRSVKRINDKAKNKPMAMKLPSGRISDLVVWFKNWYHGGKVLDMA